jgi:hypothetical protein
MVIGFDLFESVLYDAVVSIGTFTAIAKAGAIKHKLPIGSQIK